MALTYGTAAFTSGQQAVTSVSLDSGTLTYFQAGTEIAVGANPQIATVEAQKATSASSFNLKEPWAYSSGTYAFLASNTSEAFANGIQAAKGFQDALQSAVDNQGTAAAADVQTSPTDATSGRALTVGAFGLGSIDPASIADANQVLPSGFYEGAGASAVNFPGVTAYQPFISTRRKSGPIESQTTLHLGMPGDCWIRQTDNGTDWEEGRIWTEGNLIFATNNSGSAINNSISTAGSSLTPSQAGTWQNVSGGTINNGSAGLWMKV